MVSYVATPHLSIEASVLAPFPRDSLEFPAPPVRRSLCKIRIAARVAFSLR